MAGTLWWLCPVLALVGNRLFREEILEPVLAVTGAKDFGAALALANESEFALVGPAVSSLS